MTYQNQDRIGKFLILLYLSILIWALSSCGVVKKNEHTYVDKVDSTFTQVKKEDSKQIRDSSKVEKEQTIQTDSATIHIDFSDNQSDSAAYTDVTIKTDSNGTITVNTGGKKIKGITALRKHSEVKNGSDSAHVVSTSQVQKIDSTQTDLKKTVKETEFKKFSFQVPWYAYIILIIAGFALWFFWGKIELTRKLLNP